MHEFSFSALIWRWSHGKKAASWYFVNMEEEMSEQVKKTQSDLPKKRGRGSVKVKARIGFCVRETSIFPDKKSGCYLLPLKKDIREKLQVSDGDEVFVHVELV